MKGRCSVRRRSLSWARPMSGLLALVLAFLWVVPPLAASEPEALATQPPIRAALARLAATPPSVRATAQDQPVAAGEPHSFFKTPAGVVAAVLMTAGLGYAVYSASHDRKPVRSPIR